MSTEAFKRHVRCSSCGTVNRITRERLQQRLAPVCGHCKTRLPVSLHPTTVTDDDFDEAVVRSPLPVLLDFWAAWCGPCRMIAPMMDELAAEYAGRVQVCKLNIDENPRTASRYGVRSIPTLLVFKDGREVDRIVGVQAKRDIMRRLDRLAEM
jgi:thioredoxin